jgi:Arc/MetJ family transcription regulator
VEETAMPTNLAIDDKLIEDARRMGKHRTKREAVNEALREYVQHRKQLKVLDLFGTIDIDPGYDYKKQRKRA